MHPRNSRGAGWLASSGGGRGMRAEEVTGEADVLPGKRRGMGEQLIRYVVTLSAQVRDNVGDIGSVPIRGCSNHQVQARSTELLGVVGTILDAALLAFVEARPAALPERTRR
jgi:hypothetical protein